MIFIIGIFCGFCYYLTSIIIFDVLPYTDADIDKLFFESVMNFFTESTIAVELELDPDVNVVDEYRKFRFHAGLRSSEFSLKYWLKFSYEFTWELLKLVWTSIRVTFAYILIYFTNIMLDFSLSFINEIIELQCENVNSLIPPLFKMWMQVIGLAIVSIWARGVGPRFRPDQLSNIAWKDLLILLVSLLLLILAVMIY